MYSVKRKSHHFHEDEHKPSHNELFISPDAMNATSSSPTPGSIPVESLGPAGIRGELHVLAIMKDDQRSDHERLLDNTIRTFKVAALLSRALSTSEHIKGDFGPEDGNSYFLIPESATLSRVRYADGMFEFKKNSKGEKSVVYFECTASSTTEAQKKFSNAVLPFIDHLSYLANCPTLISTIRVEDPANDRIVIEYISPYRQVTLNIRDSNVYFEMTPVYAMYREAKNSHSNFYAFMCYYKILEGLLGSLRNNIFIRARTEGITLQRPKEKVPASIHIADQYKTHVGKRITTFFSEVLTPQFRNAIAHFMTDDGSVLNMSDFDHVNRYADVLFITEICVREVIRGHESLLYGLQNTSSA